MKLKDILNEKIEIDVEIGDTILTGRFKNKKTKVNSIETDQHGMPTINGRKVTTFRTMKKDEGTCGYSIDGEGDDEPAGPHLLKKESKDEIKVIHNFLTKHTKSAKKASDMIKKYYKKVKKQFRGDSSRDVAMAIVGYDVLGENKDLFKMYTQAMKMMPGSPKQKELIKKISSLRKKLKMDEAKAKRDYKDEYKKFQSSTKAKKYRAELNQYNRKKGTYGNGDGKDASHKGGKIVGFESQSKNRGRREKSRLKKK